MLDLQTRLSRHEPTCPRAQMVRERETDRHAERIREANRINIKIMDIRRRMAEHTAIAEAHLNERDRLEIAEMLARKEAAQIAEGQS